MKTIPEGIFDLKNSDKTVSSYYTISDLVFMINKRLRIDAQVAEDDIRMHFSDQIMRVGDLEIIEEIKDFKEIWGSKFISDKKRRPHNVFDHYELVLYSIFCRVVGEENVFVQFPIPNTKHRYDFMVQHDDKKYLIEFEGLSHFKPFRGKSPVYPLKQLEEFNNPNYTLILWPYWIQRCELNLKVILGLEKKGLGAIWSSTYHFGQFSWNDSHHIITQLNQQFNIERNGEIGYMYGPRTENRNNPENPVIENLNRRTIEKLIPKGTSESLDSRNYWLPIRLKL